MEDKKTPEVKGTPPSTETRHFDRIVSFDTRSRLFPMRVAPVGMELPSLWSCSVRLDQGSEGACVGYALAHALSCLPPPRLFLTPTDARSIYHAAQRMDLFPGGSYTGAIPFMEGTSVLAGMKACIARKLLGSYKWAFSTLELIEGLTSGPAVLGLPWYKGMIAADNNGFVRPSGSVVGGHAICCRGWDPQNKKFVLRQSWGPSFGDNGDCYITFSDMDRLLSESGEACFPIKGAPPTVEEQVAGILDPRPHW